MYTSRFLPVKVQSASEAAVHTAECIYPWKLLEEAHDHLTGVTQSSNVILSNNNIRFASDPDIRWFMCDVVNAYEYFLTAKNNKFSFFPIYSTKGVASLYVSTIFKNTRLLVDAYSMSTVLVTKQQLIKKLSSMIDQRYEVSLLLDIFRYARLLESGSKNFLDAWLVNPLSEEGYVAVNPVTALYTDNTLWYAQDVLEEIESIVKGECDETDTFILQANCIDRKDLSYWTPMSMDWCKYIVETWRKLESRSRSYIPLALNDTYEPACYCSTDFCHVVRASTGEHVTVKNKNFKDTLRACVKEEFITPSAFYTLWEVLRLRDDT